MEMGFIRRPGWRPEVAIGFVALLVGLQVAVLPAQGAITEDQVNRAIDLGRAYLRSNQQQRGTWVAGDLPVDGVTALAVLALLNCGDDPGDSHLQLSLEYLRNQRPTMTYTLALQTMVLCRADPVRDRLLIRKNVNQLQTMQITVGENKGAWGYSDNKGNGDRSNSQFALLALNEAEQIGIEVEEQTWRLAQQYWLNSQQSDGSWNYFPSQSGSGSMTSAGITSLVITSGRLTAGDASVEGNHVHCCGLQKEDEAIQQALAWLGKRFSVDHNPSHDTTRQRFWYYYYLYGVERVGRLTGSRFIGSHDWYRSGADALIDRQTELGGWKGNGHAEDYPNIATSLALLFLSKGRRPVLISKLQRNPVDDWNRHRSDIANLTRFIEQRWQKEMTWQVVDAQAAQVNDLLTTPVLFLNGRDGLDFSEEEIDKLQRYIEHGGFLFAEACCDGERFDRDFRELVTKMFPQSQFRLLPADHPIWHAESPIDPKHVVPLYGVDACCRTSIVYCPQDLSCYWELSRARGDQKAKIPLEIQEEIEARLMIGASILAYATGRELKGKLDLPLVVSSDDQRPIERGTLQVPKISHEGGSDDAPNAVANLLDVLHRERHIRVSTRHELMDPTNDRLGDHPLVFLHGRRHFHFTSAQRKALRQYVERGGIVFADAICANSEFSDSLRRELKAIFPEKTLERIPDNDSIFTRAYNGFDLARVARRVPEERGEAGPLRVRIVRAIPHLEAIELDGRYVVIFSPFDLSCALEQTSSLECPGYSIDDAARIGVNVILYALQE